MKITLKEVEAVAWAMFCRNAVAQPESWEDAKPYERTEFLGMAADYIVAFDALTAVRSGVDVPTGRTSEQLRESAQWAALEAAFDGL